MKYNVKNNPRVIIVQKIYSHLFNNEKIIIFPKHRFKKFIKDVVNGTLERDEIINQEISNYLKNDVDIKRLDKVFEILLKSAIFEILYKPNVSKKVIIQEYLNASNFFVSNSQTKYLNALLDKISKQLRN